MSIESKVGLFLFISLVSLILLSTQVSDFSFSSEPKQVIHANIDDATGLFVDSKVLMNGVEIGKVTALEVDGGTVHVLLSLGAKHKIPVDSTLQIIQESVLGAKQINIIAGSKTSYLHADDTIKKVESFASFEQTSEAISQAANSLKALIDDAREVLDDQRKNELRSIITQTNEMVTSLNEIVSTNKRDIGQIISDLQKMTKEFAKTAKTVNADLPEIMTRINTITLEIENLSVSLDSSLPTAVEKFIKLEDNVSIVIEENRESLKSTLTSADNFFTNGENAFDKVDALLSNFTVSELQFGMHANYLFAYDDYKSFVSLAYLPNPTTYYIVDLIAMSDYSIKGASPQLHDEGKFYISAMYGKRFNKLLLRGGLIQSTGGLGADLFLLHDTLKFSMEAYDFNAVTDVRGSNPHLSVEARYQYLKHLEFFVGVDNFINTQTRSIYLGVGFKFIDNNLKYLLGSSTLSAAGGTR